MGYFANSSEGAAFEETYCARCVHNGETPCAVMLVHELYNYDQLDESEERLRGALNLLIDEDEYICRMFHAKEG